MVADSWKQTLLNATQVKGNEKKMGSRDPQAMRSGCQSRGTDEKFEWSQPMP